MQMDANSGGAGGAIGVVGLVLMLAFIVLMLASGWKVFTKAGQPGWASIIPIYNIFVMLKIVGKPWWWFIGMLIPLVNFVVMILLAVETAKVFGKGIGFAIGLLLLPFIFYPILAFGDATYSAPPAAS
jgi:hypothetical protein